MRHWQPTITHNNLYLRAEILATIRRFFAEKKVLEVETPLACSAPVTDPFLWAMETHFNASTTTPAKDLYLQTSPEYAMKRLLAAGSGDIYQITKAFRNSEVGRSHNPEFTMLEWYRLGFDHHDLMKEVAELLGLILSDKNYECVSYQSIFLKILDLDPLSASLNELKNCAQSQHISLISTHEENDPDTWLQLLMSHVIEPRIGQQCPTFIYDFPATQAALAQLNPQDPRVAARFEVYAKGLELANGFFELSDSHEQRHRFNQDLEKRRQFGLPAVPIDENFLSALEHGLPSCAGVALGLDRVIMLAANAQHIQEVISFSIENA